MAAELSDLISWSRRSRVHIGWACGCTNRDGGADRCPAPFIGAMAFCNGSGRAGGQWRGRVGEWIDWWFADEEAESLADFVSFQM